MADAAPAPCSLHPTCRGKDNLLALHYEVYSTLRVLQYTANITLHAPDGEQPMAPATLRLSNVTLGPATGDGSSSAALPTIMGVG
jgi:hypothetical protein